MTLTFGSVFAGIGGLDLGLERAGMVCEWQIENDAYASAVLAKHWPDVKRYGDVYKVNGSDIAPVDLICGGVPCQPWSVAGKRKGNDDERDLWPEFWRLCLQVRPRYVLVEEVPGFAVPGGLGRTLSDLARAGYSAEWFHLSAADVGAPHLRKRLWIVAYSARHVEGRQEQRAERERTRACCQSEPLANANGERLAERCERDGEQEQPGLEAPRRSNARGCGQDVADSDDAGLEGRLGAELRECADERAPGSGGSPMANAWSICGEGWSPDAREADGGRSLGQPTGPSRWLPEPDVGRVAHGVPSRVDRLRCLGNAVVPQVAEAIGRMILNATSTAGEQGEA